MENRRQQATRRLRCLLALAGDYLRYVFMKRRRLMHKVARKALALVHHHGERKRAIMEYEFSCADSPSPAFLAAKRLLLRSSRLRSGGAAAATAVSSCCFGSFRAPSPYYGWGEAMASDAASPTEEEDEDVGTTDDDEEEGETAQDDEDRLWLQCGEILDVDDRAEEFINMFYEQLRAQSFAAVFGAPREDALYVEMIECSFELATLVGAS